MTRYLQPHIVGLAAYTPGEQINAPGVIKLNTNENPYPPSPAVAMALASLDPERLRKYPPPLADEFRTIAGEVLGVHPEAILAGNGGDELLRMIATTFLGPGRAAAACYPAYTLYEVLAAIAGARMAWIDWPADYSLPIGELASAGAAVTFLANPNAPTGTLVEPEAVSELAGRLDGVLVVDEAYVDFAGINCLHLVARHDNLIVLRSLSKGYSLAGLRFGFAVASPAVIAGLRKVKDSYNCDAISIALAAAAIADQAYMRANVARVVAERDRLTGELRRRGWDVLDSRSNFILARPPDGAARRRYEALKQRDILVRYFDSRRLDDRLRITTGTPAEHAALLAALDEMDAG